VKLQRWIAIASSTLLIAKFTAYYLTNSVSILTDALESIVNVIAGFIGLYSLHVAAKPKDMDHPYGHGKFENVSGVIEGLLIFVAALLIISEAVKKITEPSQIGESGIAIAVMFASALINTLVSCSFGIIFLYLCSRSRNINMILPGVHYGKELIFWAFW
jgi:cation diffusion facilitator family transporter